MKELTREEIVEAILDKQDVEYSVDDGRSWNGIDNPECWRLKVEHFSSFQWRIHDE